MDRSGARERLFDWLWFLVWGVASSIWCITAAGQLSATWDEPVYVSRGLESWRTGSNRGLMKLGTMPLPVDVVTGPLYLWERWQGMPLDAETDLDRLLPWARAGTLVFWWLLLFYGRLSGRQLAGPWGGRLAVALLACEPSFLAHASLATTDIAITACLLALVYHFRTGREAGWLRRVGLPTCWFAAAVLAKASGLVFGPLCLLAVELERVARSAIGDAATDCGPSFAASPFRRFAASLTSWRDLVQITAGGIVLTFLYCGSDWQAEPSFVAWADRLPDGAGRTSMVWMADHLRVFSNAGEGLMRQVTHNVRGHGAYLLGRHHPRALWYYFPVLMTIKLSLPLLLAPLLVALIRPKRLLNWACLAAAALLAFSFACRVQIGIRFMLPLAALAIVGLAASVVWTWRDVSPGRSWRSPAVLFGAGATAGVIWTAAAALAVWPQALCYVNELWGGTAQGYRQVSEANYDWGQGLKELARWHQEHGRPPLEVWYYGTDPTLKTLPLKELPLHALPIKKPDDVLEKVRGHYLAVSTSLLYGSIGDFEPIRCPSSFLLTLQPVDRTTTFLIYDFRQP